MPKIRNIIIFVAIAVALILIYIFFIKPSSSDQANLVSSTPVTTTTSASADGVPLITEDFLKLLLSVKHVRLDDSIFADPAFGSLHDSSIVLVPDATTGRPNPFAQFGSDAALLPTTTTIPGATPATTTAPAIKPITTPVKP